jgi:hypothetical protein
MRAHHQFDQTEKIIQTLPKFNAAGVDTFARAIMLSRSAWARRAKSAKTGVNALVAREDGRKRPDGARRRA